MIRGIYGKHKSINARKHEKSRRKSSETLESDLCRKGKTRNTDIGSTSQWPYGFVSALYHIPEARRLGMGFPLSFSPLASLPLT